jgi:hypothetical protein
LMHNLPFIYFFGSSQTRLDVHISILYADKNEAYHCWHEPGVCLR